MANTFLSVDKQQRLISQTLLGVTIEDILTIAIVLQ